MGGYLLGSIPFGVIATRLGGAGDVRKIGSGNIGATNVLQDRPQGPGADHPDRRRRQGRGRGAGRALPWRATQAAAVAGGAAFLGHLFPVWLKFKGGKGVATFLGTMLAAAWPVGVLDCATWLAMAGLFRISSLAALTAAALTPLYCLRHATSPIRSCCSASPWRCWCSSATTPTSRAC